MTIAIQTKYLGATNHKPSRIKAYTSNGHSCTIPLAYDLSNEKLHFEAVKALIAAGADLDRVGNQYGWNSLSRTQFSKLWSKQREGLSIHTD